jgi:Protein of unknown function (DUF2854)
MQSADEACVAPWQVLEFEKKPEMAFEEWTSRQDKFQSFFGPGVKASLEATEQVQQVHRNLPATVS